jgi:NAD(P)H-hydrate epimerase
MIDDFCIGLVRMMENAGRSLAHLARERFLDGDPRGRHVVVLAGTGGNGGGAMVAARRLHGYGATVTVYVTRTELGEVPRLQAGILEKIGVSVHYGEAPRGESGLIIDGIIGYSLEGAPRGVAAAMIDWANGSKAPVLALDVPSGLDTSTGTAYDPAIRAAATVTLALPKEGLRAAGATAVVGELYLADISVPGALYAREPLNLDVGPIFAKGDLVRLA